MLFFGQYAARLDAQHRAALPRALRDAIGDAELRRGLVLTRGLDGCLWLFPASSWAATAAEVSSGLFRTAEARMLERLFFGGAVEVMPDAAGRIALPEALRERAGINGPVLFVGAAGRIEIWDPARWQALEAAAAGRYEELAEAAGGRL